MEQISLGIFGGTFDPIHIGHLCMAEWVLNQLKLAQIIFVPAGEPPHKTAREITPASHRLEMLKLAIQEHPHFVCNTYELEKKTTSYTVETLRYFAALYPEKKLYFIIGLDSLLNLKTWHHYQTLSQLCSLVVIPRVGHPLITSSEEMVAYIHGELPEFLGKVIWVEMPNIAISSTQLRQTLARGQSARYFFRPGVWDYICQHQLYGYNKGS